jgi:hypothetical protein
LSSAELIGLLGRQQQALREVTELAQRQREALRQGRLDVLQDLLSRMGQVAFTAQQAEAERDAAARALAASLGVEPRLSALSEALAADERKALTEAGDGLMRAVASVKSEMEILTRLMKESSNLNEMLLAEWQRLQGGMTSAGRFDARG